MNRVLFSSASVEWATPLAVYDKLNAEFQFDFDPCPVDGTNDGLALFLPSGRGSGYSATRRTRIFADGWTVGTSRNSRYT